MAECWFLIPEQKTSRLLRAAVLFLSLAASHALPTVSIEPAQLVPPAGASVPIAGKPLRQGSLDFASRSNSPDLAGQVASCSYTSI
jgi:hypothetical protein